MRMVTDPERYKGEPFREHCAFSVYLVSSYVDGRERTLLDEIVKWRDIEAKKQAVLGLQKFVKVAAIGKSLTTSYDEKECHETHDFEYGGKKRVAWRIRHGTARLIFYYGNNRLILLTNAIVKRKDKLSKAEKNNIEKAIIAFVDAEASNDLTIIDEET